MFSSEKLGEAINYIALLLKERKKKKKKIVFQTRPKRKDREGKHCERDLIPRAARSVCKRGGGSKAEALGLAGRRRDYKEGEPWRRHLC